MLVLTPLCYSKNVITYFKIIPGSCLFLFLNFIFTTIQYSVADPDPHGSGTVVVLLKNAIAGIKPECPAFVSN